MSIRITDTRMTSEDFDTVAERQPDGSWTVTGYLGRAFDRNQAITAMTLAEALATNPPPDSPLWPHIAVWRTELATDQADGAPSAVPAATFPPDGARTDRASSPTNTQGTAPSRQTKAAPCTPHRSNGHEVTPS